MTDPLGPLSGKDAEIAMLEKERAELLIALEDIIDGYDEANPLRTADYHGTHCLCLRCCVDYGRSVLSKHNHADIPSNE